MRSNALRWIVGAVAVAVLALYATAFQVREGRAALVTRFGDPVREVTEAGLHWKLPWPIDRANPIDRRQRVFETRHGEMLTRDKKNLILLAYAAWRVEDNWTWIRAVGSREAAEEKLDSLLLDAQAKVVGRYDLSALVSTNPEQLAVEAIEAELLAEVQGTALERYGIQIAHVGFKRLSLPEENIAKVFGQMRAERAREAATYQGQGEERAASIRAETDEDVATITAAAEEEAARIRGKAEAEAAEIYATAQARDPELYKFLRTLRALETVLGGAGERASLILRTDSAPFQLLGGRLSDQADGRREQEGE
jgi:modulator of FtsH protease HflC